MRTSPPANVKAVFDAFPRPAHKKFWQANSSCKPRQHPTARSLSFAGSLLALLALLGIGVFTS